MRAQVTIVPVEALLNTNKKSKPGYDSSKPVKVVITMPAYNAAKTLEKTFEDIPHDLISQIIMVDDCSHASTVSIGQALNLTVIKHPHNVGYGGNQKTGYLEALRSDADIVIMLHPDYQYDPTKIPELIEPILRGEADIVLGSRFLNNGALAGGMPYYKFVANRCLTTVQNIVLGTHLSEFHTGYRAYSRKFLETVPFLRNSTDFVFDAEILCQAIAFNFRIAEIGVATRYFPEASSINFRRSVIYGLGVLNTLVKFSLSKCKLVSCDLFTS